MYAMQRANGDWFGLDANGRLRMPVFRHRRDAVAARLRHRGMMLFKPAALDERALADLARAGGAGDVNFWLVDDPFTTLRNGRPVDRGQLVALVRDAGKSD